jgi:RNA polymerase sigma-70 factor, ECF subfamily
MATMNAWASIDELSLIRDAQGGDSAAHEALVRIYEKQVFNIARRIMKSTEDAEDVVQEVFMSVLKKLPSFRGEAKFSTWLHRVTLNTALSQLRRDRGRVISFVESSGLSDSEKPAPESTIPDARPDPEESLVHAQDSRLLAAGINLMRPGLRSVLLMRDVRGLSIKETASALNLSIAAVKTRLLRARLTLREHMISSGNGRILFARGRHRNPRGRASSRCRLSASS